MDAITAVLQRPGSGAAGRGNTPSPAHHDFENSSEDGDDTATDEKAGDDGAGAGYHGSGGEGAAGSVLRHSDAPLGVHACLSPDDQPEGVAGGVTGGAGDAGGDYHTGTGAQSTAAAHAAASMGPIPEEAPYTQRPASPGATGGVTGSVTGGGVTTTPRKAGGESWRARLLNSSDPMVSPGRITLASKIKSARLTSSQR